MMMKKKILLCIFMALPALFVKGQNSIPEIKKFEFEISVGTTYGIDKFVGDKKLGPAFALEGRYNFSQLPMDIGVELYLGSTVRGYEEVDLSNRIFSFMAFTDYNFNRGKNISPFVGLGMGIASCDVIEGSYGEEGARYVFSPRIGVEFFRHLRVTCYSKICQKGYNNVGLSIGYAFGGGLKKR